jgi:FAD-dependent oxidoreductase domain-containing protein 1
MKFSKNYDVIMVGGGVMGSSIAYYLLKEDPNLRVAIIEMDPSLERNSTVLSDGNLRLQFNIKENILISQYGLKMLDSFREDMRVGDWIPEPSFRQEGNLFITDADNKKNAMAGLALQKSLNCQVSWLESDEIMSRFPLYDVGNFPGGSFGKLDGTMDPQAILAAYLRKAIHLGAEYISAEVAELLHSEGQVIGVKLTNKDKLSANTVVNSAGAWGTAFAKTAGIDLPIDPVRRQVFVIETNSVPEKTYPLTVFPSGLYLIPENNNRFMCGRSMDEDPVGFDFNWNHEKFMDVLWPELVEVVPSFEHLKIVSGWAGLYAVNRFDGNAILGEWPELGGFILVNGFSGHGFQQCHAIGRYLAEQIRGVEPFIDLSIFSPQRLLENKPVFEGAGKLV